jgi:hypothetical protein
VNPVAGEILLAGDSLDFLITDYACTVVRDVVNSYRESDSHGDIGAMVFDDLHLFPGFGRKPFAQKKIFASVTGNAKLRKTQDIYVFRPRLADSRKNVLGIINPVKWDLIYGSACDS